jgi:hypothetical protein
MVFISWVELMRVEGTEAANSYDYVLFVNLAQGPPEIKFNCAEAFSKQAPAPCRCIIQKKLSSHRLMTGRDAVQQ